MRAANWSWCVLVAAATAGPAVGLSPTPGPSDVLLSYTLDWGNLLTWTLATMPSPSLLLLKQRIDKEWKKGAKWAYCGHTLTFSRVLPYFARLSNTRNVTIYPRQSTRSLLFLVWLLGAAGAAPRFLHRKYQFVTAPFYYSGDQQPTSPTLQWQNAGSKC